MNYPDRCRIAPWNHQVVGTAALLERPAFILMDDVGVGKSKQLTDATCIVFNDLREIDTLLVVSPGFARSVWASPDPLLGEFAKHAWDNIPYELTEYSAKRARLPERQAGRLDVVVTNYEFIRRLEKGKQTHPKPWPKNKVWPRLEPLYEWAKTRRTWLVLDESWAVENPHADQTVACYLLRQACQRVTLLNGTPGSPDRLFSQFQILDPRILECENWYQFRGRYCVMGVATKENPYGDKKIVAYQNVEDFERRTKPYGLRREAKDCLDLPELLPPSTLEARLTPKTWAVYTSMRDEMVAWLSSEEATIANQAGTKALRLAQILAGFVGGVQDMGDVDLFSGPPSSDIREIGREKLNVVLDYIAAQDLNKVVVWCRFRAEMARMAEELKRLGRVVHLLQGQQPADERNAAKRAFAPGTDDTRAAVLVGHPAAGGAGLNFSAASVAIYATNPWSIKDRKQSEGRIQRPGQVNRARFVDVVAVGPKGQKTVDHGVLKALRSGEDIAMWTAAIWRQVLTEE